MGGPIEPFFEVSRNESIKYLTLLNQNSQVLLVDFLFILFEANLLNHFLADLILFLELPEALSHPLTGLAHVSDYHEAPLAHGRIIIIHPRVHKDDSQEVLLIWAEED